MCKELNRRRNDEFFSDLDSIFSLKLFKLNMLKKNHFVDKQDIGRHSGVLDFNFVIPQTMETGRKWRP